MDIAIAIISVVLLFVPVVVVGYVFIWAAKKDGEDARAYERRRRAR